MDRIDYIRKFSEAGELQEKQILMVDFWRDCAKRGSTDVFTQNFLDNHVGNLSDALAKNIAKARSFNAAANFTSTLLAESSTKDLITTIASDVIPWLVRNTFVFRNYLIERTIQSITIKVSAEAGGGVQTGDRIQPVIGIDPQGLVNHFHGPAEYALGEIFKKTDNKGTIEWKKVSRI